MLQKIKGCRFHWTKKQKNNYLKGKYLDQFDQFIIVAKREIGNI